MRPRMVVARHDRGLTTSSEIITGKTEQAKLQDNQVTKYVAIYD